MRLGDCHNFHDFRELARRRLPSPIFDYIDGGADDEVTLCQNTESFERCDLVPNILRGVESLDLSVTVMGQKLAMPVYCSPTALQRLFHHDGERAVAGAAAKFGTMFGVSSLGTVSLEELRKAYDTPQAYQFYFHKDRALNHAMMQRAKQAGVNVMMLTVDSITGGNRERDLRMSVADAKRAVDIGCTGIILSNHGGRQLDGSRSAFDQLAEIVDAVGD
jgi:L-lactate dehydrogenase (cytochrome)